MSSEDKEFTETELYQAFVDCARQGEAEILREAIAEDKTLVYRARDPHGNTALHMAAGNGLVEIVDILLHSEGVKRILDAKNDCGNTALHWAVVSNKPEVVDKLLKAGARITIRNAGGNTPLREAELRNNEKIALAILNAMPLEEMAKDKTKGAQKDKDIEPIYNSAAEKKQTEKAAAEAAAKDTRTKRERDEDEFADSIAKAIMEAIPEDMEGMDGPFEVVENDFEDGSNNDDKSKTETETKKD